MNETKQLELAEWADVDTDDLDFDSIEQKLENELQAQYEDLETLKEDYSKIGNPNTIGDTVMSVVWEQFVNQIGVVAGEDFIKENRGLTLDLRESKHIQTGENFATAAKLDGEIEALSKKVRDGEASFKERFDLQKTQFERNGLIATHNYISKEKLEYNLDRFENKPHSQFRKQYVDPGMDATLPRAGVLHSQGIDTVKDIYTGRQIPTETKLEDGRNNPLAAQREHVQPSAKIYKNPSLQMANSDQELGAITNDKENLQGYTTAERNNRKSDKSPEEMIGSDKNKHWEKANRRAEEHIKRKEKEGEERLRQEGIKTRKEEAFRIGGHALRSALMGLLASLIKEVIKELISWLRSQQKKFSTFIESIKEAIKSFISNIKTHLITAGNTLLTTIAYAIIGPVVGMVKKAWIFLKQGYKSLKEAISYLKDPANKQKPFSIKILQVGKILVAGLTAGGALVLGEVIEKGLMAIPIFAVQIPLLGSLANILGIFFGALVSGLIGALALNLIDRLVVRQQKKMNQNQQFDQQNKIIHAQEKLLVVNDIQLERKTMEVAQGIINRHMEAVSSTQTINEAIDKNTETTKAAHQQNQEALNNIEDLLNSI